MSSPKYTPTEAQLRQVANNFSYHTPKDEQPARYGALRGTAKAFALHIIENTPPSREQALALTKLEEAVMWANAAIARNE